ncbi:hypothetical protein PISMIDRAFT_19358 [Pisolithus microcarpus 441]|uniref:Uncharacterized protein n=1 Tax=Pisolithus microcarpus 441 TaxID=765257 RepID=A0A0C9Y3H6_9AGAM|nr:hypothetical protein PISMIDRAFT_19358 [Pisolithus microcarpus 441]
MAQGGMEEKLGVANVDHNQLAEEGHVKGSQCYQSSCPLCITFPATTKNTFQLGSLCRSHVSTTNHQIAAQESHPPGSGHGLSSHPSV